MAHSWVLSVVIAFVICSIVKAHREVHLHNSTVNGQQCPYGMKSLNPGTCFCIHSGL